MKVVYEGGLSRYLTQMKNPYLMKFLKSIVKPWNISGYQQYPENHCLLKAVYMYFQPERGIALLI